MLVQIVAVGKIKEKFLQEGIGEYEKRLRPYLKLRIVEISEEKRPPSPSRATEAAALEKEGQRILSAIPDGSFVIVLDIGGLVFSSVQLAASFRDWEISAKNQITFVIGGDLGLSGQVLSRSDLRLSLSKMTFTHPMARLILVEQIYRACRINSGEPYHK